LADLAHITLLLEMLKFTPKILFSRRNIFVKEIESVGIFWNIPSMKWNLQILQTCAEAATVLL
jgi:hypothetical protein